MTEKAKVTLRVTSSLEAARAVVLEPWTGEYTLRPGGAFAIIAEADPTYPLGVELNADRVIVYCFDSAGAKMSIFEDGIERTTSK